MKASSVMNGARCGGMRVPAPSSCRHAVRTSANHNAVATRAKWRDALQGGGSSGGGSDSAAAAAAAELNGHPSSNGASSNGASSAAAGAVPEGLINPQFAAVLSSALQRSGDGALFTGAAAEARVSPLKPVEEMLMTALAQSRGNLRKLTERQAALEAELAAEAKQASRLEWLLSRVRADYAYFGALDQMSQDE